jgi:hypothetical protein
MNDVRRVRRRQPAPRGQEDVQDSTPGVPRPEPVVQGLSLQELHCDEHVGTRVSDVVDGDHVRMREPRQGLRLAQQPHRTVRDLRADAAGDLDGNMTAQGSIAGFVDLAHRAARDAAQDLVPGESGPGRELTDERRSLPSEIVVSVRDVGGDPHRQLRTGAATRHVRTDVDARRPGQCAVHELQHRRLVQAGRVPQNCICVRGLQHDRCR